MAAATALFVAAAVTYAAAAAFYTADALAARASWARAARLLGWGAFALHMTTIGARGVAGSHPVSSVGDAIGFLAWIMVGGFLLAQRRRSLAAVGAFVAPAALVLLLLAYLVPDAGTPTPALGVLGRLHITLASVGVSILALSAGLAVSYLLQERQLKQRRIGPMVKRGTALETLDRLSLRCVQIGFPIFTIAMVTGAMWMAQSAVAMRIEYPVAALAWAAYAALLVARTAAGWRGRRAAWLALAGFAATLTVLALYLLRELVA